MLIDLPGRSRTRRTICAVALALAVTALAVSGCSSSGDGGQPAQTALAEALGQIADTSAAREYVEFGRPAETVAITGKEHPAGPYVHALGYGVSNFWGEGIRVDQKLGIDLRTADYAVTVGEPPRRTVLLAGVAASTAATKLTALGAARQRSSGGVVYRFRRDNRTITSDKLFAAFPAAITELDVVRIDGSDVRFGPSTAAVDETRAGGPNLLGDDAFRDLASCLGNPLAAVLTDKLPPLSQGLGPAPAARLPKPTVGVRAVGVGVSGTRGATPTEQLCVSADNDTHAKAVAASIRAAVDSGSSSVTHENWSRIIKDASVTVDGSTVRLTAQPVSSAGVLLVRGITGDLPGVAG